MAKQEKEGKLVKNLPETRGHGVQCKSISGQIYVITHDTEKEKHTLWKEEPEGYRLLAIAESPYDLYPLVDWEK